MFDLPRQNPDIMIFFYFNKNVLGLGSGVDMISERGIKKINDIAKWEGKIGKSPTLSKH